MTAIRIRTNLKSATLHLPQLRPFFGRTVEITVVARSASRIKARRQYKLRPPPRGLPPCPSLKALAAEQGVTLMPIHKMLGGWPKDELDDDFEGALREWRKKEVEEELRRRKHKKS